MAYKDMKTLQFGVGLDIAAALEAQCSSSVAAYLRSLLEAQEWQIARAVERLRAGQVSDEEMMELAAGVEAQRRPLTIAEAAALVVEARAMGRDPMVEVDRG